MRVQNSLVIPVVLVLIAMVSIQSGASFAKRLFPILGPSGTTSVRLILASLILSTIWRPWRARLTRSQWLSVGLYGLALGAMNALFYQAIERIPLGLAVGIEFTGPLSVSLFASRKAFDFALAGLAIVGIALILPHSQASEPADLIGVLYALGAGACWALYIVCGQRAGGSMHGGMATTLGMIAAAICAAPIGVIQAGSRLLDYRLVPLALAVSILSSALPYSLEMLALKRLPAQSFGILMSVEPAIAALSGLLLMNERLTPVQWIAIACIMLASFGSVFRRATPPPQSGEALTMQ